MSGPSTHPPTHHTPHRNAGLGPLLGGLHLGAEVAVTHAAGAHPIEGAPVLLGAGGTFVYRVGSMVVKVYPPDALVERHEAASRAGARLALLGVPLVAPVGDGRLRRFGGTAAGLWTFVEPQRPPTWGDLGALLRACHTIPAGVLRDAQVPPWDPTVATRWATGPYRQHRGGDSRLADTIDAAGVVLTSRSTALVSLGAVLLHGDAQLQNVIVGAGGARLIDLDWLSWGPAVVDLAPIVVAQRHGAVDERSYTEFARSYGVDPASVAGVDTAAAALELSTVMFNLALACRRREPVGWLAREVERVLV